MRLSGFNYYLENKDNLLIYNCLSRKAISLPLSLSDFKSKISELDKEELKYLKKYYFLTNLDSLKDEYDFYYKIKNIKAEETLYIVLTTTTRCNLHCDYCFENHIKRISMSDDVIEKYFILLENRLKIDKKIKKLFTLFFGGEPLLDPEKLLYGKRIETS